VAEGIGIAKGCWLNSNIKRLKVMILKEKAFNKVGYGRAGNPNFRDKPHKRIIMGLRPI
jgi:hypothetical protein